MAGTAAPNPANADEVVVERHRRRERELASLYATARSLTVLQEVDDVLTAIVRNAHDLIGTDVTYLSVLDDQQRELILRAAEGTVSAEFRAARVKPTIGVAGHAIRTRTPFWVTNYRASSEIVHDIAFDDVLAKEGLVSLLGVPLIAGDRVLGVLYGGNRFERPFPPEEVALLSAFADHAAVALENARLYDQRSRALADLTEAYSTIEAQVAVMERSAAVHEALTKVVLAGGDAGDIAALLSHMMGGDVHILDRDDRLLVSRSVEEGGDSFSRTGLDDGDGSPVTALAAAIGESRQTGRAVAFTAPDARRCDVAAVVAGDSYLGTLVLSQAAEDLHEVDVRTVERAAQIMGLLTLQQDAIVEAEERVRGELLTELLTSSQPPNAQHRARGRARGLDLDGLTTLIAFSTAGLPAAAVVRALRRVSRERSGLSGEHLGVQTLLVGGADAATAAADAHAAVAAATGGPVIACATPVDPGTEPMSRAFTLAARCCRLLTGLGVTDGAATTQDLALYAMVFDPDRESELRRFLDETLGALRAYDAKGRADLLGTLRAYFANGGNLTRSARALHVHMNTLLKRLERVAAVIGGDWQEPDRALRLHLALRMDELASGLGSS